MYDSGSSKVSFNGKFTTFSDVLCIRNVNIIMLLVVLKRGGMLDVTLDVRKRRFCKTGLRRGRNIRCGLGVHACIQCQIWYTPCVDCVLTC